MSGVAPAPVLLVLSREYSWSCLGDTPVTGQGTPLVPFTLRVPLVLSRGYPYERTRVPISPFTGPVQSYVWGYLLLLSLVLAREYPWSCLGDTPVTGQGYPIQEQDRGYSHLPGLATLRALRLLRSHRWTLL